MSQRRLLPHTTATRSLNVTGLVNGGTYAVLFKQDSTGGAAATLGTGCTWYQGGAAGFTASTTLSLTTTASAINAFVFIYDGTNCYGNHIVYCSEECRDKWGKKRRKARRAASRLKGE